VHPAHRWSFVFLALTFAALIGGGIWGAVTKKSELAFAGGWAFLVVACVFLLAAAACGLFWRRSQR
jgi:hypothetical protein